MLTNISRSLLQNNCRNARDLYILLSNRSISYFLNGNKQSGILQALSFQNEPNNKKNIQNKYLHGSPIRLAKKEKKVYDTSLTLYREFENVQKKNKETFLEMVNLFNDRYHTQFKQTDFINAAIKQMDKYGVSEDLDVYKALLDIFPKGKYIPETYIMGDLYFFPDQVDCGLEILWKMEHHGVYPDMEVKDLIVNIYGKKSRVYRKFAYMMYWLPKVRYASPWLLPKNLPNDVLELAKMAIQRITSVDSQTEIDVYQTETVSDSLDKTWIVHGQSKKQMELLNKHDPRKPVIVEGGDRVYLRKNAINYFILKSDEDPPKDEPPFDPEENLSNMESPCFNLIPRPVRKDKKSVHEQDYETIYAVCATGTSSKDSLLSWIRILQEQKHPILGELTVLFRFKIPLAEPVPFTTDVTKKGDIPG